MFNCRNYFEYVTDCFCKVENLLDDEDFRFKVTREELEDLCQDLFSRIGKVVQDALTSSEMSMVGMVFRSEVFVLAKRNLLLS